MRKQEQGAAPMPAEVRDIKPWHEWHAIGTTKNKNVVSFIRDLTGAHAVKTQAWHDWTEKNENVVPIAIQGMAKWEYSKDAILSSCSYNDGEEPRAPQSIYVVDLDALYTMTYTSSTGSEVRFTREEREGIWKIEVRNISAKWPHQRATMGRLKQHMGLVVPRQFVEPSEE